MVYWTTADGDKIPVDEMTDLHVFNALRVVFKRYNISYKEMPEMLDEARNLLEDYLVNRDVIKRLSRWR